MFRPSVFNRGRRVLLAGASVLAMAIVLGGSIGPNIAYSETSMASLSTSLPQSYADIVALDKPAVVTITTELQASPADTQSGPQGVPPDEFFRRFFGDNGPLPGTPGMPGQGPQAPQQGPSGTALGSGFIVSADGHVVTNNHVVENATKITVTLDDGRELPAKLIGVDTKNDIAVLKVDATSPLPTIAWGNSDSLRAGDPILAIGDPFGIGTTVTSGIVSARGRDLHSGPYDDFIQVDAAINHGNSGGPLVDVTGKVVGINTAIFSPNGGNVGVGFAIPAAQAQAVVAKIIANGSIQHGFIGVTIQPLDDQIAGALGLKDTKGALVATVQDNSPAAAAGLRPGDVILSVNGLTSDAPRAVSRAIADLSPGETATLALWRDGKALSVDLTVGNLGGEQTANAEPPSSTNGSVVVAPIGIEVATLSQDMARAQGLPDGETGAIVTSVRQSSSGADNGLREGDVILSVNQSKVASADDVVRLVSQVQAEHRNAALLLIERGGNRSFVAVPLNNA